ncbi:MAG: hypothetical protein AAF725_00600 [Acidobacteriota bacterium]
MHRTAPCSALDAASDIDPWDGVCTSVCPLDDPTCAQVCPNWGCIEYDQEVNSADFIEITVDNDAALLEGDAAIWTRNLNLYTTMIGDDFAYVGEGDVGAITYETTLPEAGEYHVFLQWHRIIQNDEAVDARVGVTHAGGVSYQEVDMFSADIDSQFNYIGTFDFQMGPSGQVNATVRVDNATTGDEVGKDNVRANGSPQAITADAVRFVRQPQPSGGAPGCSVYGWRCEQPLCPQGGCLAPLGADDPTSKFFQAKQALYEVLGEIEDVNFGFATYEQDDSGLVFKHYAKKVRSTQLDGLTPQLTFNQLLPASEQLQGFDWPMSGAVEVFGTGASYDDNGNTNDDNLFAANQWNCNTSFDEQRGEEGFDDDHWIGCTPEEPADVNDIWELERFKRIPRLGRTADIETRLYIRDTTGIVYRIDYEYLGFNLGSPVSYGYLDDVFGIQLDLHKCTNAACNSSGRTQLIYNMNVYYDKVGEYSETNGVLERRNNPTTYFQRNSTVYNRIINETRGTACFDRGLEPNNDLFYLQDPYDDFVNFPDDDAWWDYPHKWEWRFDDRGNNNVDGTNFVGLENDDNFYYDEARNRVSFMDYGDMVPLDWDSRNVDIIRRHLAPNAWRVADGADPTTSVTPLVPTGEIPDFRTAVYFNDEYELNESNRRRRLTLKDSEERPILASGMTPLNRALRDFREWYLGPNPDGSCDLDPGENPVGWCQYAAVFDLNWLCREKFVLMITDGDETCDIPQRGDNYPACDTAAELLDGPGIRTFVVGFGLPELEGDNALQCMAEQGGTGEPILPKNKDELVRELLALFSSVKAERRSFASASIPAVQSSAADKIYLTSFTPIPGTGFWPGRVDVFRQPLPLTDNLQPDVSRECTADLQSGCHLYDVAEKILDQAPSADDIADDSLPPAQRFGIQVGQDDDLTADADESDAQAAQHRRIFYGMANPTSDRTQPLRLLWPNAFDDPDGAPFRLDLADVLVLVDDLEDYYGCDPMVDDCTVAEQNLDDQMQFAVGELVRKKQRSIQDENGEEIQCTGDPRDNSEPCTYVLGDVFHANPQVTAAANDFDFFRQDLCGVPLEPGTPTSCVPAEEFASAAEMRDRGYREFARRTTWRRRMLTTATNDGQLHFFDAGKYIAIDQPSGPDIDVFTDGSGYELFSYMPRMVMPVVRDQVNSGDLQPGDKHIFSMDGTPKAADVFIDPVPDDFGEYSVNHREWRSILIGGTRESGDVFEEANDVLGVGGGYYALDITTPDPMVPGSSEFAPYVPETPGRFLPQCLSVDSETGLQEPVPGCETLAGESVTFPLELWTFQDMIEVDNTLYPLDEDINGFHDLGDTWSTPLVGQVRVCRKNGTACDPESNDPARRADLETRWVAIVGGGMDPQHKNAPVLGNAIYFIDIELGEVLYKRHVVGAVPTDVAGLDIDSDGVLDRVYFGTTEGLLYKIDLDARTSSGQVPAIREVQIGDAKILGWEDLDDDGNPVPDDSERKFYKDRIIHPAWDPFVIFEVDGPIYYPPSLFKIPEQEFYGFTLATGDREDLWEENGDLGFFIVGVDEDYAAGDVDLPLTIDRMVRFPWDDTFGTFTDGGGDSAAIEAVPELNLLLDSPASKPGWVMTFPAEFRSTGEAFVLSGLLIFSMFEPLNFTLEELADDDGSGAGDDDGDTTLDTQTVCSRNGTTFAFVTFLQSSASLFGNEVPISGESDPDPIQGGCGGRCEVIDEFTTAIHTESSVSKNPGANDEGDDGTQTSFSRPQTEREKRLANQIREAVLDLSPRSCQFNENYEMLVSALRNTTGINVYARIPMLVCPGDWRN